MRAVDAQVRLDPVLAAGLTPAQRQAATVLVLRGRAEALRGRAGSRSLLLALRATEAERQLLTDVGLDAAAELLRGSEGHPAVVAAIDRWVAAVELAERLLAAPARERGGS
ncbi:MAG: hypothetical protein JWM48_1152 [Mycobacterium sp.]|nr:hypothetical protein [Mycobacterium sp.]MCW2744602.1 hypothetical protein [Mycobacterium sp.]